MRINMNIHKVLQSSAIALTVMTVSCFNMPAMTVTQILADENTNTSYETTSLDTHATAIDITVNSISGSSTDDITAAVTDGSYDTTTGISKDDCISIKSDEPMYGVYILWGSETGNYTLSYESIQSSGNSDNNSSNNNNSNNNDSHIIQCGAYGYLHDYIPIDEGTTSVTIRTSYDCEVSDIYAYSAGTLPSSVQVWQPPCDDDTDILVFSTHADDEILFLGGVLANYGGEQGLNVQVAYMCNFFLTEPVRQHEELDGLWECGITHYPVKGDFMDLYSLDLDTALTQYDYDDIVSYATSVIRRFRPLVCVSQDFNGEYGHGNHRIYAKAVSDAVNNSSDASFNSNSASTYGTWDVPKTYYHLYNENTLTLDIDSPLERFGGRTTVDVLKTAFQKHVSQISYSFNVMDNGYAKTYWGNFDMRAFGLYRTTVGYDTGNDMMENVTTLHSEREAKREEARIQAEKEKEAQLAATTSDNNDEDEEASSDNTSQTPDIKQLAITLAAILIIGVVIGGQAYRTRNLYKKKYNENKDEFNKDNN